VLVNLLVNKHTGLLERDPQLITRGFIYEPQAEELLLETVEHAANAVHNANGSLQKDVERALKDFFYTETKRRPMVFVTTTEV
jgi:ribonuclease J